MLRSILVALPLGVGAGGVSLESPAGAAELRRRGALLLMGGHMCPDFVFVVDSTP